MKGKLSKQSILHCLQKWTALAIMSHLFFGCKQDSDQGAHNASETNVLTTKSTNQIPMQTNEWHWDQAKADALRAKANRDQDGAAADAYAAMMREKREHEGLSHEVPLPNQWAAGPGLPQPIGLNFYQKDERYPDYLLCLYDVEEHHYDQSNELGWLKASLFQIRGLGQDQFPPIKWAVIVIRNRTEHEGASTFEKSFKLGVVVKANDIFDPQSDLLDLLAKAQKDRHPFLYDSNQQPNQRWVIVERHAATNIISK
jgi:hypothetical protein